MVRLLLSTHRCRPLSAAGCLVLGINYENSLDSDFLFQFAFVSMHFLSLELDTRQTEDGNRTDEKPDEDMDRERKRATA
jgi:hypothetical protein